MIRARRYSPGYAAYLLASLCFAGVLYPDAISLAETQSLKPNPEAERWVLERVAAGEIANLKERFPDEADRVLSASFLEDLLTGSLKGVQVHRHGVRIAYATVPEPIDLVNADMPHEIWLDNCRFKAKVDMSRSVSHKSLSFEGTIFEEEAKFSGMTIREIAQFSQAVFKGPADFTSVTVASQFIAQGIQFTRADQEVFFNFLKCVDNVFFHEAVFAGPVEFAGATVARQFYANGAQFKNSANFNGMTVGDIIWFNDAVFSGPAYFTTATFTSQFNAKKARFADAAIFNSVKVGGIADYTEAVFEGPVSFVLTEIDGDFKAPRTQFKKSADFNGMTVGDIIWFNNAVFSGPAYFTTATVARQLIANEARFADAAIFNSVHVGESARFNSAVFAGPVDFVKADIKSSFRAERAHFKNAEKLANFSRMKVGEIADFFEAVFEGPVTFALVDINGDFDAPRAQFKSADQQVKFNGMKVGGAASFLEAVFAGPVAFTSAIIGRNFKADEAQFTSSTHEVILDNVKVNGIVYFRKAFFGGALSLADATFLDLLIHGRKDDPLEIPRLDLSRTVIRRELAIKDVNPQDLVGISLRVEGPASLQRLTIRRKANLEHSNLLTLTLSEVSWPTAPDSVQLDGMTYQHITAGPEKDSWKKLMQLVDQSLYSASVYATLEEFFRRQGYPERANRVFVAQKRRERSQASWGAWFWNHFMEIFVRHGRSPARAFGWGALLVLIGCFVFHRKEGMQPQKPEDGAAYYNALWYSLDLFLPFIDLHAASVWMPKEDRWFARHYMRVHKILGWVLIPIGLAAVTGIIK